MVSGRAAVRRNRRQRFQELPGGISKKCQAKKSPEEFFFLGGISYFYIVTKGTSVTGVGLKRLRESRLQPARN